MPTDVHALIETMAKAFSTAILTAVRGATLEEVMSDRAGAAPVAKRGPGRPRKDAAQGPVVAVVEAPSAGQPVKRGRGRPKKSAVADAAKPAPSKVTKSGRLARRTQADIEKTLAEVVALVKRKPGLRAEHIRAELKLEKKEMPRILETGLASKSLTKRGEKRATAYSAR